MVTNHHPYFIHNQKATFKEFKIIVMQKYKPFGVDQEMHYSSNYKAAIFNLNDDLLDVVSGSDSRIKTKIEESKAEEILYDWYVEQ